MSEEIEEHRRHIELILECCREIQNASGYDVRKIFSKVGETLSDQMAKIRKHEMRINRESRDKIEQLNTIT